MRRPSFIREESVMRTTECKDIDLKKSVPLCSLRDVEYAVLNWLSQNCHTRTEVIQQELIQTAGLRQYILSEFIQEFCSRSSSVATDTNMALLIVGAVVLTLLLQMAGRTERDSNFILSLDNELLRGDTLYIINSFMNSVLVASKLQRLTYGYQGFIQFKRMLRAAPGFVNRISSLWISVILARMPKYTVYSLCDDYLYQYKMPRFSRFQHSEWLVHRQRYIRELYHLTKSILPVVETRHLQHKFPNLDGHKLADTIFGKNVGKLTIEA